MNYEIPLNNVPNQEVSVILNGQDVTVKLREIEGRQHISVSSNGRPLCYNILLVDRIPVLKYGYLGFIGDLCPVDLMGTETPTYEGWNTRFRLIYYDE